ncbi:MAG: MarR family transcriptional regulator [Chloroflexi bacterium]|jgi:DNA-binding MarR family transcriptional regulator|nr:MarR family transcriptional regulator [Chloroflexota bacterium]
MLPATANSPALEEIGARLVGLVPQLVRLLATAMHAAPHTAGMTLPQFRVLARLHERDYRASELAACLEIGRPTLTTLADALERRGLIERVRDLPDDRRGVRLRLTAAGETLYRALQAQAIAAAAQLVRDASPAERAALVQGLAALERGLQRSQLDTRPANSEGSE